MIATYPNIAGSNLAQDGDMIPILQFSSLSIEDSILIVDFDYDDDEVSGDKCRLIKMLTA